MAAPAQQAAILIQNSTALPLSTRQIRVVSANLAHGRSDGAHQLRQSGDEIKENLYALSQLLQKYNPDIVALQEADAASWWSGGFNHVQLLAMDARFPVAAHGLHVHGFGLHYGTGLLSRWRFDAAWSHTFPLTPPTMSKGFTLAKMSVDGQGAAFYVASLHTDFASPKARAIQLDYLATVIEALVAPCMVIGDFNCSYLSGSSSLPSFLERLQLKTYKPESTDAALHTFPTMAHRIDWICIPRDWSFQSFQVLTERVSDHLVIVADIAVATKP